jgi:long-subunit fatty acid transport protein
LGANAASQGDLFPGSAMAGDVAFYYNNYLMLGNSECLLGLGLNASNIGSKISYDEGNNTIFLPANLKLGGSLLFPMDEYNTLAFNMDINKYMFPTPPDTRDMNPEERQQALLKYYQTSPLNGLFKSFSEAPGGMREKYQEITWSFGAEYAYDQKFFVRGGYFYENPYKGNRQYFSVGAGFKMNTLQVDASYLISTVPSNPLDQTLRFSLSFDMDGLRNLMR